MKFLYAYKTPDGVRHEETLSAASREEVFATLRGRGIKAIKVVALDGPKANGEVPAPRRRSLLLPAATAILAAAAAALLLPRSSPSPASPGLSATRAPKSPQMPASPLPRQTIYGNRIRLAAAAAALPSEAERFLAHFAEPGRPLPPDTPEPPSAALFRESLARPVLVSPDDFTETVDLKRIVAHLKREMRLYLEAGGSTSNFVAELVKRQKAEISSRERAAARLEELLPLDAEKAYGFFLKANAHLKSMGIHPIPLPDQLRDKELSLDLDD